MMLRNAVATVALFGALMLAGCDSGPSGPGTLIASVTGNSLGGVVLEITGVGIQGFEGLDNTQAYAAPLAGSPNAYRVLLIVPGGGDLRFEIQVEDVGMDDPVMTVVSAAGADNLRPARGRDRDSSRAIGSATGLGRERCSPLAHPPPFGHLTRAVFRSPEGAHRGPAD